MFDIGTKDNSEQKPIARFQLEVGQASFSQTTATPLGPFRSMACFHPEWDIWLAQMEEDDEREPTGPRADSQPLRHTMSPHAREPSEPWRYSSVLVAG